MSIDVSVNKEEPIFKTEVNLTTTLSNDSVQECHVFLSGSNILDEVNEEFINKIKKFFKELEISNDIQKKSLINKPFLNLMK